MKIKQEFTCAEYNTTVNKSTVSAQPHHLKISYTHGYP
jgi:hypothetical protein